jgi:hypothetical protein
LLHLLLLLFSDTSAESDLGSGEKSIIGKQLPGFGPNGSVSPVAAPEDQSFAR